jgi:RNA polymerase sigma factor (sigma-70 family)
LQKEKIVPKEYFIYMKSVLTRKICFTDILIKEDLFEDSYGEAVAIYYEKRIECTNEKQKLAWLGNTAANIYMHLHRFYNRNEVTDPDIINNYYADSITTTDDEQSLEEFIDKYSEYCDDEELELLVLHYHYGYTLKEISVIFNTSESAIKQRHKRIKDKLRKVLPLPKQLFFINMKIFCHFLPSKREYI